MNTTQKQNRKQKKFRSACLTITFVILIAPILVYFLLVGAGSYLVKNEAPRPVDAIVVLSGDEGARVEQAVEIYQSEKIKYFVFTRTDQEYMGGDKTYSQTLMRIAINLKVPSDSMLVTAGESSSTEEEAKALLILAEQRNITSYFIVTDPYHTRRTDLIFNTIFEGSGIQTYVHAVQDHWYRPATWMFKVSGWKRTVGEYLGMFAFTRL
jgi:uncharacterized SAM-binding protein YcdF (DUF218 family)